MQVLKERCATGLRGAVPGTAGCANYRDTNPAAKAGELSPEVNHGPGLGGAQQCTSLTGLGECLAFIQPHVPSR